MTVVERCPMSDLPVGQCALPCHRDVTLPAGVAPVVVRGVEPTGTATLLTLPATEQHEARDTRVRARRPKPLETCRYDPDAQEWVTPEHVRDCRSNSCRGCKPCGRDHCAMRGQCPNHVEPKAGVSTCPQCIGACRDTITECEELAALVDLEVEHAVIDSDVVNLAGPFADPLQRSARRAFDTARGWCDYPRPDWYVVDDRHPEAVFTRWELRFRQLYGRTTDHPPQLWPLPHLEERRPMSQSGDYFRRLLSTGMPHDDVFDAFDSDMRRLRAVLEDALVDSRKPETGAPCPTCTLELKLAGVKDDDGNPKKAPRLERRSGHWCDDPKCKRENHYSTLIHPHTGEPVPDTRGDKWICPVNSAHEWKEADYRLRVAGEYLTHAKRLTASDLHVKYGIKPANLRKWAQRGQVKKHGTDARGRMLYDVADARACEARRGTELEETTA